MLRAEYSVCCEPGDLRRDNQDRVFAARGEVNGQQAGIFMVADGCGGMALGEKISTLLAESFSRIWEEELPRLLRQTGDPHAHMRPAIADWVQRINASAYTFGQSVGEKVGSTLSLLVLLNRRYYICNAGDSRVYRLRADGWERLTEDQSLVADMLRNGELSEDEAARFPRKNVLTMCVGYFEQARLYFTQGKLRAGDLFLLCSDGLYNALGAETLDAFHPAKITPESAGRLRRMIPPGGAADNVSALLVELRGGWRDSL